MSNTQAVPTLGQELMRVAFSGNERVKEFKMKFATLFDELSQLAMDAEVESEKGPSIHSPETIKIHMELIRRNDEATRCYAEACKILETACMYAVKGLTA